MSEHSTIAEIIELISVLISVGGIIWILKKDLKSYGILYIVSSLTGALLCLTFVLFGFYSFPVKILPHSLIPLIEMITVIPFYVLLGVKFSPIHWAWKIPFYWAMVHVAMVLEILVLYNPVKIIDYHGNWDSWDSYTWWWIFLLLFELIGGKIVPRSSRTPLMSKSFRYGRWAWIVFHFIMVVTIFLGGFYVGWVMNK